MITSVYASLAVLLMVFLALKVINARHEHHISLGDGDNKELLQLRGAHSNATEYIPVGLVLLFLLEYNNGLIWLVHLGGIALLAGRLLHANGMLSPNMKHRVLGMKVTLSTLIALAIINLLNLFI